jgi:ABC-2 type transport system ATP-binding protein
VIRVEGLTKRFPGRPLPALEDASLDVRDGEILGLVGLNGAGKTTTIRIAAGLSLPSAGRVWVDELDIVAEKRRASEHIAWVPELFPFDPGARALPLLVYFAGFHGLRAAEARPQCRELLARVGLESEERGRVRDFSQGMKKRLSLASAMISDPSNLLLDEILNGLDPEGIAFVRNWVIELRRRKKAVLLSSHQLAELEALADRVTFVHRGRILRTIDRGELARAGGVSLRLTLRNLDAAAVEYLSGLGPTHVSGATIWVARPTAEPHLIVSELVRRGYQIDESRAESTSLEAYFLELIGGAK